MEDLIKLSLKNLQVDYVDLYLIHFPVGFIGKDYKDVYPTDENGMTVFNMNTDHVNVWKVQHENLIIFRYICN